MRMVPKVVNKTLKFKCSNFSCRREVTATREEYVLVTEEFNKSHQINIDDIFENLINDPCRPLIRKKCINSDCDNTILTFIRDMHEQRRIFLCPKCKTHW